MPLLGTEQTTSSLVVMITGFFRLCRSAFLRVSEDWYGGIVSALYTANSDICAKYRK